MLNPKLRRLANKIQNRNLRDKVIDLLSNPAFVFGGKRYENVPLDIAPAGISRHHSYQGGYLEHAISTTDIALALSNSAEHIYGGKVNRDHLIAGCLLHDVFKPVTYEIRNDGSYDSTLLADYLDHLSLVTAELVRRDFPIEVVHMVCSHMGNYSPIRPHTLEALICHIADLADSRLNGDILNAATFLVRKATGEDFIKPNSKEAFEIVHSKSIEGWEGVAKMFEKIMRKRATRKD